MERLKIATAGESHGPGIIGIISGIPSGVPLSEDPIKAFLSQRRLAPGRSERMDRETDECEILSGVRKGLTIGSPITVLIRNRSREKWESEPARYPRPGHADWPGVLKRGFGDTRDVWERASARSTAALAALGAIASVVLGELGIVLFRYIERIGDVFARVPESLGARLVLAEESTVSSPDPEASIGFLEAIEKARELGKTLGGAFVVGALGLPPGLGDYTEPERRLDGRIAAWLMSIPGVRAIEIGEGIKQSTLEGREAMDGFSVRDGRVERTSNLSGGMEGGMTNGQPILVRCWVKPIPTQRDPLPSFDVDTLEPGPALSERADICAAPAAAVIAQGLLGIVLLDAVLAKFGGDSISELKESLTLYRKAISKRGA
ncbi:MAG: chorismate synthase [candidate division WOR-3 bacterium]